MPSSEPYNPPKLAERFLRTFCRKELQDEVLGDLYEHYQELRIGNAKWRADMKYWYHVFHFLRPFAFNKKYNSNLMVMYNNYLKFAWRIITKHKAISLMNIVSLSIGFACFIFISIYVNHELSYDQFHDRSENIKRIAIDFMDEKGNRTPDATTPPALAPALINSFEEVGSSVRFMPNWGNKYLLGTSDDKRFFEEELIRTDSTFFDVFSFPFLYGSPNTALDQINSIVLTKRAALKHFGKMEVIGEEITLFRTDDNSTYVVTGVLENIPENSHFTFDYLTRLTFENIDQNWGWFNFYTYVKMNPLSDEVVFENKLQPFYEKQSEGAEYFNMIYSQPLTDIHLKSKLKWELGVNGDMTNIYIFSALGIFVLLISCLNYLNLTIAQSFARFKEVGVRKTFGAHQNTLAGQFVFETILITIFALIAGVAMAQLLFMNLESLIGFEVKLYEPQHLNTLFPAMISALFIGILSGVYPAVHFASFKVATAVKGVINSKGKSLVSMRKVLLAIQFALSAIMICGSLVVYEQLNHLNTKNKGLSTDQVLVLENANKLPNQATLKSELESLNAVSEVGFANGIVGGTNWTTGLGYPDEILMNYIVIDDGLLKTLNLELLAGRNFDKERKSDYEGLKIIVNETGLEQMGYTLSDIGLELPFTVQNDTIVNGTIVGVVKDFHFTNYKSKIQPYAFLARDNALPYAHIKLSTNDLAHSISELETTWNELTGGLPMEYYFLDETFNSLHLEQVKLSKILLYLTTLSILIAFIGMYAIANITIKDQLKEIALRKVLGGSVISVSQRVINKFLVIVLIANIIGLPIAYVLTSSWLNEFAYRITVGIGIFFLAISSTMLVAWLTVGYQSFRAAITNPAKVLKQD